VQGDHRRVARFGRRAQSRLTTESERKIKAVERAYRNSTRALSAALLALGLLMIAATFARGGGPLAIGVVIGVMFALVGAGRLYLARTAPRRERG
jgi:hypothetical protein